LLASLLPVTTINRYPSCGEIVPAASGMNLTPQPPLLCLAAKERGSNLLESAKYEEHYGTSDESSLSV
jgi:hypothetical protein